MLHAQSIHSTCNGNDIIESPESGDDTEQIIDSIDDHTHSINDVDQGSVHQSTASTPGPHQSNHCIITNDTTQAMSIDQPINDVQSTDSDTLLSNNPIVSDVIGSTGNAAEDMTDSIATPTDTAVDSILSSPTAQPDNSQYISPVRPTRKRKAPDRFMPSTTDRTLKQLHYNIWHEIKNNVKLYKLNIPDIQYGTINTNITAVPKHVNQSILNITAQYTVKQESMESDGGSSGDMYEHSIDIPLDINYSKHIQLHYTAADNTLICIIPGTYINHQTKQITTTTTPPTTPDTSLPCYHSCGCLRSLHGPNRQLTDGRRYYTNETSRSHHAKRDQHPNCTDQCEYHQSYHIIHTNTHGLHSSPLKRDGSYNTDTTSSSVTTDSNHHNGTGSATKPEQYRCTHTCVRSQLCSNIYTANELYQRHILSTRQHIQCNKECINYTKIQKRKLQQQAARDEVNKRTPTRSPYGIETIQNLVIEFHNSLDAQGLRRNTNGIH